MPLKDRSFYFATGAVVYVALAASQQGGVWLGSLLALLVPPPLLAWVWKRTHAARRAQGPVSPTALTCLRVGVWGCALWCAARVGPAGRPALDMFANIGAGSAAVAASVALARLPHGRGLLKPPPSAASLDAAYFNALLWGVASALPGARAVLPWDNVLLDPLATDYATTTAAVASLLVITTLALRLCLTRRLELGVADRSVGALALSLAALCISVPAAAADIAAPDRTLPVGLLGSALACIWAATTPEPTTVSRGLRGTLAVMILGAPIALTLSVLARSMAELAGPITLFASALAIGVGLFAHRLARPLGPEQSRWLVALEAASRAALDPAPDEAIAATLRALQAIEGPARTRPALWRADPAESISVDAAGYLHTSSAVLPQGVYELAEVEPERTLRHDVLLALSVRRPDVRPLAGWMEEQGCFALTLIEDEQGPAGFLLFPRGSRRRPLTLEEARAARRLADRLSAVLGVSSALARSRQRELAAEKRLHELEQELSLVSQLAERRAEPRSFLLERAAESVRQNAYSAAARLALARLERLGRAGADVALELPVGVDLLGWAALLRLSSPACSGPFVVADAAESALAAAAHWESEESPLARARGGLLLLENLSALPSAAQDALAIVLAERKGTGSVTPAVLLATVRAPLSVLAEQRRVSRALAQFFAQSELRLPALLERPEDLRALVFAALAASGARDGAEPLGIEPQALRLLVDYAWPGNDLELRHVVGRAAHIARGPRVTLDDLAEVGFSPLAGAEAYPPLEASSALEAGPMRGSTTRRRRRR